MRVVVGLLIAVSFVNGVMAQNKPAADGSDLKYKAATDGSVSQIVNVAPAYLTLYLSADSGEVAFAGLDKRLPFGKCQSFLSAYYRAYPTKPDLVVHYTGKASSEQEDELVRFLQKLARKYNVKMIVFPPPMSADPFWRDKRDFRSLVEQFAGSGSLPSPPEEANDTSHIRIPRLIPQK
ncbi:hypothetical protein NG895_29245 [Aeoliella sp. ICT_H6.2]|uniref:Uncharacterized protein n=1 Tax=Aeoliella straminimaris TaxID=2954799 RepID=A0A9X2FGL9_9BACT|nr:hypothetical protein [Aeoliella straminimaris]MCO6048008.1 hypothetical protein [Aeoliella straminimaris]